MRLSELKKQREILDKQINDLERRKQKRCKHPQVSKSGGGMWHDWPDWGYNATYLTCLKCELVTNSHNLKDRELYRKMERNIVEVEE